MEKKESRIIRGLDSLGRIVLPAQIRKKLKINCGDPLEIYSTGDGRVILEPYAPSCIFCLGTEDLRLFRGKLVCCACRKKLSSLQNIPEIFEEAPGKAPPADS